MAPPVPGKGSPAFLLTQVGAHAAQAFAKRIASLAVTPAHAGILRILKMHSPLSQRELAAKLGIHASRLVAILDEMEKAGLAVREPSVKDRRVYLLRITEKGLETLKEIGLLYQEHNAAITAALSDAERDTLTSLLERIAADQGLSPGIHPGYRSLSARKKADTPSAG
jgi:DNA-binding MarR family transcriptional regulator